MTDRKQHWNHVYATKRETDVSWFEAEASLPFACQILQQKHGRCRDRHRRRGIETCRWPARRRIHRHHRARFIPGSAGRRQAPPGNTLKRHCLDRCRFHGVETVRTYRIWHDRAAFHFLTAAADRAAYVACLKAALEPGGCAIIGAFAPSGPEMCSGLPVVRYDAELLGRALGPDFEIIETRTHAHQTPAGRNQDFQFSVCRRQSFAGS